MTPTTADQILDLYSSAIAACRTRDGSGASSALLRLIGRLDLEQPGAILFCRVYEDCLTQVQAGHFTLVAAILASLRDTWTASGDERTDTGDVVQPSA